MVIFGAGFGALSPVGRTGIGGLGAGRLSLGAGFGAEARLAAGALGTGGVEPDWADATGVILLGAAS